MKRICAYCRKAIEENEKAVVCRNCGGIYHKECFEKADFCNLCKAPMTDGLYIKKDMETDREIEKRIEKTDRQIKIILLILSIAAVVMTFMLVTRI